MKATELIQKLQSFVNEVGDVEVFIWDTERLDYYAVNPTIENAYCFNIDNTNDVYYDPAEDGEIFFDDNDNEITKEELLVGVYKYKNCKRIKIIEM